MGLDEVASLQLLANMASPARSATQTEGTGAPVRANLPAPTGAEPELLDDAQERLPPGPSAPASLQAFEWFRRPVEWMERQRRAFGPIFRARLGPLKRAAFVGDPKAAREIFRGDASVLRMGDANGLMRPVVGSGSILLLDGEQHLAQRRLLLPPFHGDHVQMLGELIAETAERRLSSWPLGRPFAVQPEMEEISFSTILAIVLGTDSGLGEARIRALFPRLMDLCRSPLTLLPRFRRELGGLSPYGRLMALVEEIDEAIYAEIATRRRDPAIEGRRDLLSVLARATQLDGEPLSDQDLRDETVTLLMAGWETTTSALAWAFERLARHPEAADRLATTLAEDDRSYLDAVVSETLRQRPVIPALVRKLAAPFAVGEFQFPARWVLMPSVYLLHHDPSTYPDPHEFRPERFLDGTPPGAVWIPFGGGVRRCLGANLAELEMRVVVETAITRFELRPTDPRPERPRRERFTLTPGGGAVVVAQRRRTRRPVGRRARGAERVPTPAPDTQREGVRSQQLPARA